jgi:AhpD family alkylhydroperoxidase
MKSMPNVPPLTRKDLAEFEPFFTVMENAIGFVPSSHYTLGHRPEIMRPFDQLALAVFGPGLVDPRLKQMVAFMSSVSAGCRYCQAHTSASLGAFGVEAEKVAAVFEFETSGLFSEEERVALRLARDAGCVPNATTPEHFEELRKYFTSPQIVELVAAIAIMGWLNRWNDTMATELEEEPLAFASQHLSAQGWEVGKHHAGS